MSSKRLNRRAFLKFTAAGAGALLLAACTPTAVPLAPTAKSGEVTKATAAGPATFKGEITWMTQGNFEDPASTNYVQLNALELLKRYKAAQPDVKVTLTPAAGTDT